eukprot:scaffold61893_cov51-Phaeocystis_antarctica.AAC.3
MPAQCQVAQCMRDSPLGSGTEALLRGVWSFPGVPSRQGWCVSGATQAAVGTQLAVVEDPEQVRRHKVDGRRIVGGGRLLFTAQPRREGRRLDGCG